MLIRFAPLGDGAAVEAAGAACGLLRVLHDAPNRFVERRLTPQEGYIRDAAGHRGARSVN
jgi:hypothetical protein